MPSIVIFEREKRFQKLTYFVKKYLPIQWAKINLSDNDFYKEPYIFQKNNKIKIIKKEKNLAITASAASANYIYYYDYIRQLGLEPLIYRNSYEIEKDYSIKEQKLRKITKKTPDIVFYETIDKPETLILYKLLKNKKTIFLERRFSGLGPLAIYPATGINRKNPILEAKLQQKSSPSRKSIILAKDIFSFSQKRKHISDYENWHSDDTRRTLKSVFFKMLAPISEPWARQKGYLRYRLNSLKSLLFDSRLLSRQVPKARFIVYFLNHLPEASTFSEAPDYHDIPSIALRLACFRPAGIKILIKEHPRSLHKRPPGFYQRLSKIPGVSLLHPSVSNDQLFASTEAVLVVTGTPGLQAGAYLTPVGVLGRPAWSRAPWAREIKNPEEVFGLRRSEIVKKKKQCIWFMANYLESTFPINWANGEESFEEAQGRAIAEMLVATYRFLRGRNHSKTSY